MNIFEILNKNPVMLAPMAGFTDLAFRELVRERGGFLAFSEMISAKALYFGDKKTLELLKTNKKDTPLSVQLFGHEPEIMAYSAKLLENMGFDMIDINCGCPAPKIYKNGDGSALMLNPHLMYRIVHEIRKATSVTLSVKLRIGYDGNNKNVVRCAEMCEQGGADFVTVHGRTREMQYSGTCDISYIKAVKDALYIPVIGNGDVTDRQSYKNMIEASGCDGVMVGRGALGNPFVIGEILNPAMKISRDEKIDSMVSHFEKMCEYKGGGAVKEGRTHLLYWLGKIDGGKALKIRASKAESICDIYEIKKMLLENNAEKEEKI